ncbi:hypothetical protein F8154_11360 [Alkaliphilus pronyensis]|uniref:Uncharacterized protein n=1 Tax=Alkaliphilus pronyensis TaxID=1482732 RepID=A0A6I0F781_9FIRM|nr:hypothetical protein [Alkaliphilus pronyensis]KAB3532738.1 hypothetical protein F8154_11360 [Alkaliphilus pronyensis]
MIKKIVMSFSVFLISITLIIGATTAYFTDGAPVEDTKFTFGTIDIDVSKNSEEDSDWLPVDGEDSNSKTVSWKFKNNGSNEVFLRAKINHEWVLAADNEVSSINGETNTNWILISTEWEENQGWYYYTGVVDPKEVIYLTFEVSIDTIEGFLGAEYKIDIEAEAIQASNNAAYYEWGTSIYGVPTQ